MEVEFCVQYMLKEMNSNMLSINQHLPQPRSQSLSSYRLGRARRDPGWVWSRVSQNLGDDNYISEGMGGLVGILSILSLRERDVLSPK